MLLKENPIPLGNIVNCGNQLMPINAIYEIRIAHLSHISGAVLYIGHNILSNNFLPHNHQYGTAPYCLNMCKDLNNCGNQHHHAQ